MVGSFFWRVSIDIALRSLNCISMYMPIMAIRAPGRDICRELTKRLYDIGNVFSDNKVV